MSGHRKKISDVVLHSNCTTAITASFDKTICIWNAQEGTKLNTLKTHSAEVTGLSMHPTGDYFISSSDDRHWGFADIESGTTLAYCTDAAVKSQLSCCECALVVVALCTRSTSQWARWCNAFRAFIVGFRWHVQRALGTCTLYFRCILFATTCTQALGLGNSWCISCCVGCSDWGFLNGSCYDCGVNTKLEERTRFAPSRQMENDCACAVTSNEFHTAVLCWK